MDSRLLPTGMTTVEGCTIERVGHDDVSDGQILKVGQNETCLTTGNGFQDLRETQYEEGKDYFPGYTPHLWKRTPFFFTFKCRDLLPQNVIRHLGKFAYKPTFGQVNPDPVGHMSGCSINKPT